MAKKEDLELGIAAVFDELRKAEEKFPGWPDDPVHGAAIVAEEAGELTKAALDFYYGRHYGTDELRRETAQTAAMAIRFLVHLDLVKGLAVPASPGPNSVTVKVKDR